MQKRGIEVRLAQKLENLNEKGRTLLVRNKDGTTEEAAFTNLILEPSVVPQKLVLQAGQVNPETLETEDGIFVVGKALKNHFPIMNSQEIDKQVSVVADRLKGIDSRYEYSPEFVINTGINSALIIGLDKDGRLIYQEPYSGVGNKIRETFYQASKSAELYKRSLWY